MKNHHDTRDSVRVKKSAKPREWACEGWGGVKSPPAAQPTPAPWKIKEVQAGTGKNRHLVYIRIENGDTALANTGVYLHDRRDGSPAKISQEVARANARLIAAAPDLLAALEGLVNCPTVSGLSAHIRDEAKRANRNDELAIARALLAQVEGGGK